MNYNVRLLLTALAAWRDLFPRNHPAGTIQQVGRSAEEIEVERQKKRRARKKRNLKKSHKARKKNERKKEKRVEKERLRVAVEDVRIEKERRLKLEREILKEIRQLVCLEEGHEHYISVKRYKAAIGYCPGPYELEVVNCEAQGRDGHENCGWCYACEKPRKMCGHRAPGHLE